MTLSSSSSKPSLAASTVPEIGWRRHLPLRVFCHLPSALRPICEQLAQVVQQRARQQPIEIDRVGQTAIALLLGAAERERAVGHRLGVLDEADALAVGQQRERHGQQLVDALLVAEPAALDPGRDHALSQIGVADLL
jgi:hypothetical protein